MPETEPLNSFQASTSTPTGDECDAAEVSPFASHTGPIKSGPPAGSQDRTDRNTTEGGSEGLSNGASQTGLVPQTSVPKRGSVARQVSWHDFHGKNLVEVREFEPSEKSEDGDWTQQKVCCGIM